MAEDAAPFPPSRSARTWLALALGLVTTALGFAYGIATAQAVADGAVLHGISAAVIGSLGAGIVGAAANTLLAEPPDAARLRVLVDELTRIMRATMRSDEAQLRIMRRLWHHYHVTSMDEHLVWRYMRLPLDGLPGNGVLELPVMIKGDHHQIQYAMEAGVRGQNVVLNFSSETAGPGAGSCEVFPALLAHGYRAVHCGFGAYETWDRRQLIGRILLSREPLLDLGERVTLSPEEGALLDQLWERGMADHDLLPASRHAQPADPKLRPAAARGEAPPPKSSPTPAKTSTSPGQAAPHRTEARPHQTKAPPQPAEKPPLPAEAQLHEPKAAPRQP